MKWFCRSREMHRHPLLSCQIMPQNMLWWKTDLVEDWRSWMSYCSWFRWQHWIAHQKSVRMPKASKNVEGAASSQGSSRRGAPYPLNPPPSFGRPICRSQQFPPREKVIHGSACILVKLQRCRGPGCQQAVQARLAFAEACTEANSASKALTIAAPNMP